MPLRIVGRVLRPMRAGTTRSVWRAPSFAAPETITVTSPDFIDGQPMPDVHAAAGIGANVSPELHWTPPPTGTAQLLLVIEDCDVPLPRPVIHTAATLPPDPAFLDRGDLRPANHAVRFLSTSLGDPGYHGPAPVPGHGPHHYEFSLYALDRPLPAEVTAIATMRDAVAGHVLARGRLTGTYER